MLAKPLHKLTFHIGLIFDLDAHVSPIKGEVEYILHLIATFLCK